jgi:hypothetical protein
MPFVEWRLDSERLSTLALAISMPTRNRETRTDMESKASGKKMERTFVARHVYPSHWLREGFMFRLSEVDSDS